MAAARKPGAAKKKAAAPGPSGEKKLSAADELRQRILLMTGDKLIIRSPLDVDEVHVVSSGFLSLDDALGVGGYPDANLIAIEGPPDSGKTALCYAAIGAHQRLDPESQHLFLAVESHAYNEKFARVCGANTHPDRLIVAYPDSAEQAAFTAMVAMGMIVNEKTKEWTVNKGVKPVASVTWDSWGGSPSLKAVTGRGEGLAALARAGSDIWPILTSTAERYGTKFLVTNHLHEKPMSNFGDPRYGKGGETFKFHQTIKLWVMGKNYVKDPSTPEIRIAQDIRVDVKRNKVARVQPHVELHLNYRTGFDPIIDAFNFLKRRGITFTEKASGSTYSFEFAHESTNEKETIQEHGEENFIEALRDNPYAGEAFLNAAQAVFKGGVEIR